MSKKPCEHKKSFWNQHPVTKLYKRHCTKCGLVMQITFILEPEPEVNEGTHIDHGNGPSFQLRRTHE